MSARAFVAASLVAVGMHASAQTVVHGSADAFRAPGVAMAWAIERGRDEASTTVVVRIVADRAAYAWLEVRGVDPFTQAEQTILAGRAIGGPLDVRIARPRFADTPRTEWRLYASEAAVAAGPAALTVYYVGVPDTTPEFADPAKLDAFLAARTAR
ncbi:MAG TPA: hypothetical protein VII68_00205 [Casimicrobiaceae bacterium]